MKNQKTDVCEGKIDLFELLKNLCNQKKSIIVITVIMSILPLITFLITPKTYKVVALFELPQRMQNIPKLKENVHDSKKFFFTANINQIQNILGKIY